MLSRRGLTTAACLWLAAAIGLACGVGMYAVPGVVTIIALLMSAAIFKMKGSVEYSKHVKIAGDIQGIGTQLQQTNLPRSPRRDLVLRLLTQHP